MNNFLRTTNNQVLDIDSSNNFYCIVLNSEINHLRYNLKDGDYHIILLNDYEGSVKLIDDGVVDNASVVINYFDFSNNHFEEKTNVDVFDNSSLSIYSTYLGISEKDIIFNLTNKGFDSHINISNNVVCLDSASFKMDVIGNILNGSKRSTCHQKSRLLTIGEPKKAIVEPVLNIDENDVEASHSLSSGTIDEEVLFYMNSRGLNKKEALLLMVSSYLLPNQDSFKEYPKGEEIYSLIEKKVKELCLI